MMYPRAVLPALIAVAGGLAGCHHHSNAPPSAAPTTQTPLPAIPDWAVPYMGKSLKDFRSSTNCRGAFDGVRSRYMGDKSGVKVSGWSWLTNEKKPADQLLFTTEVGQVLGAGGTTDDRPDVKEAVPEVSALRVGWIGVAAATSGLLTANALLSDHSLCKIGSFDISAPTFN